MTRSSRTMPLLTAPFRRPVFTLLLLWLGLFACANPSKSWAEQASPSVVVIAQTPKGWELRRNGEPYFIKGAGGYHHLQALVEAGGNSIRTWGADDLDDLLDRAHALNLTVTIGIWLSHERHGFSYADRAAVAQQLEKVRQHVEHYKDHPALLMWSLGNEAEGNGSNPLIWQAINEAAEIVKQIDPHHPTMTVFAEIKQQKIDSLKQYCPAIDVLGVNSYGGLSSLGERCRAMGLDRPYVVTEFGPLGQWEVDKTPWGAPIEQTSTQKAEFCAKGYQQSIVDQPDRCLGGYVFNWGHKQEVTPTWYSLFLKAEGDVTETVDVMTRFWSGHWPGNRAPSIQPIQLGPDETVHLKPGETYQAQVIAVDPDGDPLTYQWVIQSESDDRRRGGDHESTPPTHPNLIKSTDGSRARFNAPDEPGAYRLFVYVRDGQNHVATANTPFHVEPESKRPMDPAE